MKTNKSILTALIVSAVLCYSPIALAEKGGNGHGRGHEKSHKSKGHSKESHQKIVINSSDRTVIQQYMAKDYRANCPPGLAKKNNGCLPPGQAKKEYEIGQPLLIAGEPLPMNLRTRLQPAPAGYKYVVVDQDVLLVSDSEKTVMDAISLISTVGF